MKKTLCLICLCAIISGCTQTQLKSIVCTSEYEESNSETIYYYNEDQEVETVLIKMSQVFSEDIIANRDKDELLKDLNKAFTSSVGADTKVEVKYDEKKRRADIELQLNVDDMNERELKYLNLYDSNNVDKLMKQLKAMNLKCKKVN